MTNNSRDKPGKKKAPQPEPKPKKVRYGEEDMYPWDMIDQFDLASKPERAGGDFNSPT